MAIFKIEIERLYKEYQDIGRLMKGIFCIQYPIYCIHANIEDITSDPLDNVDRVLMEFLLANPNLSPFQLAALVGVTRLFVQRRLDMLFKEGFLIKDGNAYETTDLAIQVFRFQKLNRTHLRSFDFYLDGMSFNPLPASYYGSYRSNFISEHDISIFTHKDGDSSTFRPFGPDLVHTPPDKEIIKAKIFSLRDDERDAYHIPPGLTDIKDISFTRLSLQLLVSVTTKGEAVFKELIDGFAYYSLNDSMSYLDRLREGVQVFLPRLKEKIESLELKLSGGASNPSNPRDGGPFLTTNWPEIDRYKDSQDKCFNFTNEDLLKYIQTSFNISYAESENIVNTDSDVVINITKKILDRSNARQKLIGDLVRKREYRRGNPNYNVFLFFLYFSSKDPFVLEAIKFKEFINAIGDKSRIDRQFADRHAVDFKYPLRQLMIATGELELLERLDIEQFMTLIQ